MLIIMVNKYKNNNGANLRNRFLDLILPNNMLYKTRNNTKNKKILKPILYENSPPLREKWFAFAIQWLIDEKSSKFEVNNSSGL